MGVSLSVSEWALSRLRRSPHLVVAFPPSLSTWTGEVGVPRIRGAGSVVQGGWLMEMAFLRLVPELGMASFIIRISSRSRGIPLLCLTHIDDSGPGS